VAIESVTAAGADDHVAVLLEYDVGTVVEVEDGDGGEFGRRAARLRHGQRLGEVGERLHDGVVGGVHLRVQRERALAVAVERRVAFRCYDPVLYHTRHTECELNLLDEHSQSQLAIQAEAIVDR